MRILFSPICSPTHDLSHQPSTAAPILPQQALAQEPGRDAHISDKAWPGEIRQYETPIEKLRDRFKKRVQYLRDLDLGSR